MRFFVVLFLLMMLPAASIALEADSLYSVPFAWRNQDGQSVDLSSFKGRPVVLTLAYTSCKTACPLTMQRMKRLAAELGVKAPETQFVIVSLDPHVDTPEALAHFRDQYKLEGSHWHLLAGQESDLRRLAVLLGYSYQRQGGDDQIAHSNKIFALDPAGKIAAEVDGLESDLQGLIDKMAESAR